jgi:hypothetical protein
MQKDITYRFAGTGEVYRSSGALPVGELPHTKIDVERMKKALASKTIDMPAGLSREEKRAFILAHAKEG